MTRFEEKTPGSRAAAGTPGGSEALLWRYSVLHADSSSLPAESKVKTALRRPHPGLPFRIPAQGETQPEMGLFIQQPNKTTKDYQACDDS